RVTVSDIKKWNNLKSNMIYVGQKLKIYTNTPAKSPTSTSSSTTASTSSEKSSQSQTSSSSNVTTKTQNITHIVKSGETLSGIANKYGVTITDIKKWNNLTSDKIVVGQKLIINPTQKSISSSGNKVHMVKSGETLSSIALKYNTTVNEIMKKNNLKSTKIVVGQKLIIP
ncbi:MAG: LysM peptidoglycan-binding domain-containing protein, partial [Bacteroidales bacterium]|nr:LysM peptidoglycan-binding domain-containing protein [Bacteroidales bacterium]